MPRPAIPRGIPPLPHGLQDAVKDMVALRVLSNSQTKAGAGAEIVAWVGVEAGIGVGVEAGVVVSTELRQEISRKLMQAA